MINDIKKDAQERMSKSLEALGRNLASIRTGRAHPSILDSIKVPAWGSDMPLNQVAAITVEDARTLKIVAHDKNLSAAIEKAILTSDLGLNPSSAGTTIRVPMPALTEETRKGYTKQASAVAEDAKVAVRNVRRDGMDLLKRMEKGGDISQDEHKPWADEVQSMTDAHIKKIDEALAAKEKEIMQV